MLRLRPTPTWSRQSSTGPAAPCISPAAPCRFGGTADQAYFYQHIGIYAYRVQFLKEFVHLPPGRWEAAEKLEQLRALEHGYPIHIVETEGDTREVDSPADLRKVEEFLRNRHSSNLRSGGPVEERTGGLSSAHGTRHRLMLRAARLSARAERWVRSRSLVIHKRGTSGPKTALIGRQ